MPPPPQKKTHPTLTEPALSRSPGAREAFFEFYLTAANKGGGDTGGVGTAKRTTPKAADASYSARKETSKPLPTPEP